MKYVLHYERLMSNAKTRQIKGYREKHHIIPRCLGGLNEAQNVVSLFPEEHYTAHLLLLKIFPGNKKLTYAAKMITIGSDTNRRSNKLYGWLRREFSKAMSIERKKNPVIWTKEMRQAASFRKLNKPGTSHSDATKQKLRLLAMNRPPVSKEIAAKIAYAHLGRKASEETKAKMSLTHRSNPRPKWVPSDEARRAMSEKAKARPPQSTEVNAKRIEANRKAAESWPIEVCPHCSKSGRGPGMKRYHYDRCRFLP